MTDVKAVLVLGSGPDVLRARVWPRTGLGRILAINNAWRVRPDWDDLIHPSDFPADRHPPEIGPRQTARTHLDYVPAVNAHGGFVFCGGTMAFTAGYWALEALHPRVIACLGCDMVYPAGGASHFYGRGTADPLRADPTLQSLEAKSARLMMIAASMGCAVVNLSDAPASRLVFPRLSHAAFAAGRAPEPEGSGAAVNDLRSRETALGYDVPSGKYWKEADRFDPAALRRIDALWLDAARSYARAA
jgi:hypothetical protein